MCGIMFVKVSVISVLAVVKDLGSKEYQPRRREEKNESCTRKCCCDEFCLMLNFQG